MSLSREQLRQHQLDAYLRRTQAQAALITSADEIDMEPAPQQQPLAQAQPAEASEASSPRPILALTPAEQALVEYYKKWRLLAEHSESEYLAKQRIAHRMQHLASLSPAVNNALQATLTQIATLPKPITIYYFGVGFQYCKNDTTLLDTEVKKLMAGDVTHLINSPNQTSAPLAHELKNNADARVTALQLGTQYAVLVERYDNNKLISESYLPPDIDKDRNKLMSWASSAITSYLAAAPNTQKLNFKDGLSDEQLHALITYCHVMGYDYEVGDMQKLRVLARHKDSTLSTLLDPNIIAKLANNSRVQIDPTLFARINEVNPEHWIHFDNNRWSEFLEKNEANFSFTREKWHQWMADTNNPMPINPKALPLGVLSHCEMMRAVAHKTNPNPMRFFKRAEPDADPEELEEKYNAQQAAPAAG